MHSVHMYMHMCTCLPEQQVAVGLGTRRQRRLHPPLRAPDGLPVEVVVEDGGVEVARGRTAGEGLVGAERRAAVRGCKGM